MRKVLDEIEGGYGIGDRYDDEYGDDQGYYEEQQRMDDYQRRGMKRKSGGGSRKRPESQRDKIMKSSSRGHSGSPYKSNESPNIHNYKRKINKLGQDIDALVGKL